MNQRMLIVPFCAVGLVLLAGFGPPRTPQVQSPIELAPIQPAKLGFSYLTAAQVKDLWRRADTYAMAEAFLKQCGAPSHVERRMRLAARDCIDARALDRVAAYFRRKLAEFGGKHNFVCDTDHSKALIKDTRRRIDNDVAVVRTMCRACLIC
jgi:hypothetical protein